MSTRRIVLSDRRFTPRHRTALPPCIKPTGRNPNLRRLVLVNKLLRSYSCLNTVLSRKNFSALEKVTFTQKYMQCAERNVDTSRMGLLNTHLRNFWDRPIG